MLSVEFLTRVSVIVFFSTAVAVGLSGCANPKQEKVRPAPGVVVAERMRLDIHKPFSPKSRLGPREARIDVAHATTVLDEAYGAHEWVPPEDYLLTRFAVRSLARARGGWDARTFCERIDGALALLPDDQFHASLDGQPCSAARRERLARSGTVGANVASRGDVPWLVTSVETSIGSIPVIALTRFPPASAPEWAGFEEEIEKLRKTTGPGRAWIVDVRGNIGGDESSAERIAGLFIGASVAPAPAAKVVSRRTPAASVVRKNLAWMIRLRDEEPVLSRADETPRSVSPVSTRRGSISSLVASMDSSQSIRILTDAGCAEACERFLLRMRRYSKALLIGEPSAGRSSLMDVGIARLPHSGIEIRVPTTVLLGDDGAFLGRRGVPVDIFVPSGVDALRIARDNLTQVGM